MAVLAVFSITGVTRSGVSPPYHMHAGCNGVSTDGTVDFSVPSGLSVGVDFDPESHHVNRDIEEAVQARLQLAPFNMTFGAGDTVRLIPAFG